MIVVQLFATNPYTPWNQVGCSITAVVVAVTPEMTETVDDTGGPEWNPRHLDAPDQQTWQNPEQAHVDNQHDGHTELLAAAINIALEPVVWRAMTVAVHGFLVT